MEARIITAKDIEAFRRYLHNEDRSVGTVNKYIHDVCVLKDWLGDGAVTKEKAVNWKKHLIGESMASATVNSMIAAANKFFKYKGWNDCLIKSVKIQQKYFRESERELTRREYEKLLKTAYRRGKRRIALLMETICATGIRVSEVKYITVEAISIGRAEISLKGKDRVILIPKQLCRKLRGYAKENGITDGTVFVTKSGKAIDRRRIWAEMKSLCDIAGISKVKVFPHNLRHLFARCFYEISRDIVSLSNVLGHSSIETTRIYLISTENEHNKKIARLHLVL